MAAIRSIGRTGRARLERAGLFDSMKSEKLDCKKCNRPLIVTDLPCGSSERSPTKTSCMCATSSMRAAIFRDACSRREQAPQDEVPDCWSGRTKQQPQPSSWGACARQRACVSKDGRHTNRHLWNLWRQQL